MIEKLGLYLVMIIFIIALGYVLNYVVVESTKDDYHPKRVSEKKD